MKLPEILKNYKKIFLVADTDTWTVCGEQAEQLLSDRVAGRLVYVRSGMLVPNEEAVDELMKDGSVVRSIAVKDNYQRLNVLKFEKTLCDSARIVVHSTNGHEDAVVFEVRAY